jgi:acetylxylan esterase
MVALTLLTAIATMTSGIYGASLQRVMNFGNNPTGAEMHIYVPDNRASNPPILVASHYCGGTAQAYYSGTQFARLADQYGFSTFPQSTLKASY